MHVEQQGFFVCDTVTLQHVQEAEMLPVTPEGVDGALGKCFLSLELQDRCCCSSASSIHDT